jgi:hypothetical protein
MDEVFPESRLWPVRLVLPHRAGWSLWGGDSPDGHDFLLPTGRRYALFDTAEALGEYVRQDRSAHVLSRTPGWPHLLAGLPAGPPDVSEAAEFRFDRLARWPARATGGDLVDCLDLIRDLGAQFDDPVLAGLSNRPGLLRHLYDTLWGDTDDVADPQQVAEAAKQAVTRVAALAEWNPGAPRSR